MITRVTGDRSRSLIRYFPKAFIAALLRCSGVAHSGGRFCAFVIFKSSLLYRSKRPSFFIWSSIA